MEYIFPDLFAYWAHHEPRVILPLQFVEGPFTFPSVVTFFDVNDIDPAPECSLLCYN